MRSDADFLAELNRAQKEREEAVRAQLHSLADAALEALHGMLEPDIPPAIRLKAALEILARSTGRRYNMAEYGNEAPRRETC